MKTKIYKALNILTTIFLINFLIFKNYSTSYVFAKHKAKITKTQKINKTPKKKDYFKTKNIKKKINKNTVNRKNINIKKEVNKKNKKTNLKKRISENKTKQKIISDTSKNYVDYLINMPKANIDSPVGENVVILNPGHGFEENGATVANPTEPQAIVKEKVLNETITYELAKLLLDLNFDVYLVYDLKDYDFKLPKNNPRLHILFDTKPEVNKNIKMCQISAYYIKEIMKKINNINKNSKTTSVCLHHNHCGQGSPKSFGFISFYRDDKFVSENFANNSKNLANCFLNHCKNIYDVKEGIDNSKILSNHKWLVCAFGSDNERNEKLYDSQAAVLLELGFMSNTEELKKILDDEYRKKMAKALSKALCEYYKINEYNTNEEEKTENEKNNETENKDKENKKN